MAELTVHDLCVRAADSSLVNGASLSLRSGELSVMLGPNGAGKTSLLRGMLGLVPIDSGTVKLDAAPLADMTPAARARQISYLPQIRPLAWPNRVEDVVALGRFAHGASPSRLTGKDADAVARALTACHLDDLAGRSADTLSGGEQARMHFARALAAETPLLIADEPVAALDPRHQFGVMDLVSDYVKAGGGALVVLHNIHLAARYASRLIWLQDGKIIADGPVSETLTEKRLKAVYGISATVSDRKVDIHGPAD